jgi:hypothetical protein
MELQELPNELQGRLDGLNAWLESASKAESAEEYHTTYIETAVNAFSIGTSAIAAAQAIASTASLNNELSLANSRLRALNESLASVGPTLTSSQEYEDQWGGVYWAVSDCIAALRQTVNRALMKLDDDAFPPSLADELVSQVQSYIDNTWEWVRWGAKDLASVGGTAFVTSAAEELNDRIPGMRDALDAVMEGFLLEVEARAKKSAVSGVMPLLVGAGVLVLVMMRKR